MESTTPPKPTQTDTISRGEIISDDIVAGLLGFAVLVFFGFGIYAFVDWIRENRKEEYLTAFLYPFEF